MNYGTFPLHENKRKEKQMACNQHCNNKHFCNHFHRLNKLHLGKIPHEIQAGDSAYCIFVNIIYFRNIYFGISLFFYNFAQKFYNNSIKRTNEKNYFNAYFRYLLFHADTGNCHFHRTHWKRQMGYFENSYYVCSRKTNQVLLSVLRF